MQCKLPATSSVFQQKLIDPFSRPSQARWIAGGPCGGLLNILLNSKGELEKFVWNFYFIWFRCQQIRKTCSKDVVYFEIRIIGSLNSSTFLKSFIFIPWNIQYHCVRSIDWFIQWNQSFTLLIHSWNYLGFCSFLPHCRHCKITKHYVQSMKSN